MIFRSPTKQARGAIALVWENFGPTHADRCDALAAHYRGRADIIGVEICGASGTYDWTPDSRLSFKKETLFSEGTAQDIFFATQVWKTIRSCLRNDARHVFFCHYNQLATFLSALLLRLAGRRVYVMNDSKYDDYKRSLWLEFVKVFLYLPYSGALAGSERARDYMRFLGVRPDRIEAPYNAISLARINQHLTSVESALGFDLRHFSIIARLVPKKNIATAISAYALYHRDSTQPRPLHIYGSGPLESELKAQVQSAGLEDCILFHGFVQADEIAAALRTTLALLLPSIEEQFGFAALEALGASVPVIISQNCGICDTLVRSGVNGFCVEPMNAAGYAFFMTMLSKDEMLWQKIRAAAGSTATLGDAACFAKAVERLIAKAS
jgi:L-malate glycosyltransferase